MNTLAIDIPNNSQTNLGELNIQSVNSYLIPGFEYSIDKNDYLELYNKLNNLPSRIELSGSMGASISTVESKELLSKLRMLSINCLEKSIPGHSSSVEITIFTPENKKEKTRYNELLSEFRTEYDKYNHYIENDKEDAKNFFKAIAKKIAKIPFEDSLVEFIRANGFKLKVILKDKKLLVITMPFGEMIELENTEVVFSIFENKECLLSDILDINELVNNVNDFLASK